MGKMRLKKGDRVHVLSGKDAGKEGKILRHIPAKDMIVIEGVNLATKHVRPTQKNPKGGIVKQERPCLFAPLAESPPASPEPSWMTDARCASARSAGKLSTRCREEASQTMVPRLLTKYKEEVIPRLTKEFSYKNVMQAPRIEKIVVNIGVGEAKVDIKYMDASISELTQITGQRPVLKRAKKSVAGFKLREGMPVACSVTLRGMRKWEFLDRLLSLALPRIKDFQGVSRKGFDGRGNFNLGLKEQLIFPEIDYDKVIRVRGMNITIVTTAKNDEEAYLLLKELGMPFSR